MGHWQAKLFTNVLKPSLSNVINIDYAKLVRSIWHVYFT
jgi:hypothetical protein